MSIAAGPIRSLSTVEGARSPPIYAELRGRLTRTLRNATTHTNSDAAEYLRPDGQHSHEQDDRRQSGSFLHHGPKHDLLPTSSIGTKREHSSSFVPESSGGLGRVYGPLGMYQPIYAFGLTGGQFRPVSSARPRGSSNTCVNCWHSFKTTKAPPLSNTVSSRPGFLWRS